MSSCSRGMYSDLPQKAVGNEGLSEKKKINRKIIIIGGLYKEDVYKGVKIL